MTGNRSSRAGHINVLYSRLPLSDLILNQLDNVLINTGMRNKYPVLPDVVFPFQQIIRVSRKTLCRLATILLCRQPVDSDLESTGYTCPVSSAASTA